MADISRRRFIRNTSIGVAAAGTVATAPGLLIASPAVAADRHRSGPSPSSGWPLDVVPSVNAPASTGVVAHVVDASSGLIAVYAGTKEFVIHDTALAQALINAAH